MEVVDKMDKLEDRVNKLETDMIMSGVAKDRRMDSMHSDMVKMHDDMSDLKNTVEKLTEEIRCAVESLKKIAENTTNMSGVVDLYNKWQGFIWVSKHVGFWGAVLIAFVVGVVATVVVGQ